MSDLEKVARRIARGDWSDRMHVASGEFQTVYIIDGGTMRELRTALERLDGERNRIAELEDALRTFLADWPGDRDAFMRELSDRTRVARRALQTVDDEVPIIINGAVAVGRVPE